MEYINEFHKQCRYIHNKEVERIYLEGWSKERSYKILSRIADRGLGRYAYLLNK